MTSVQKMQFDIIQQVLEVQNPGFLKDLQTRLHEHTRQEMEEADDYIEAKGTPFEVWNAQFGDLDKMQEMQPDLGMKLTEFRRKIWEAEQEEELPIENFYKHLNKRIHALQSKSLV